MADTNTEATKKIEQKIGSTTYIVTSHFKEQGSTAKDKVQRLIDLNTKENNIRQKL